MQETTVLDPAPDSPELILMKAKFPDSKLKLEQPFSLHNRFLPIEDERLAIRMAELKAKYGEGCQASDLAEYMDVILGCLEGLNGELKPSTLLAHELDLEKEDLWEELTKEKICLKFYGQAKDRRYSLWEVKDLDDIKSLYDIESIKKHRKIRKQYGSFMKSLRKFVDKFQKLDGKTGVSQAYEQFKKMELEESKYKKLIDSKAKIANIKNNDTLEAIPIQVMEPKQQPEKKTKKKSKKEQKQAKETKPASEKQGQASNDKVQKSEEQKPMEEDGASQSQQKSKERKKKKEPVSVKKPTKQEILKSKNTSLFNFFQKKEAKPEVKLDLEPVDKAAEENEKNMKLADFFNYLGSHIETRPSIQELKSQFSSQKMRSENPEFKTCYTNIVLLKSRLEYENYPITELKVNFLQPLDERENIRYEDSSEQYSELVADSINQEMIQQEDQEEEEESNSAIVPDSICQYKSSYEISSVSESSSDEEVEKKIKPQINKTGKWFFNSRVKPEPSYQAKYSCVCLFEEMLPMPVRDIADEATNDITSMQKIEMYKEIHGSFVPKDVLIRKVSGIVENKITMNKVSSMVKEMCEKKGSQRVIKSQIIKELAEEMIDLVPTLEQELEQLREQREKARNLQLETKREQKNSEREQKLEKLILAYTGHWTINQLRSYLKENDLKMIRNDLSTYVKGRTGEQWDNIRAQIKKNRLKRGRHPKNKITEDNEEVKRTHKPIEEILKQNEIDMAARPRVEKKIEPKVFVEIKSDNQAVDDDESFDLKQRQNKKRKRLRKQSSKKTPIQQTQSYGPVRRNPRRNKAKPVEQKEEMEEDADMESNSCEMEEEKPMMGENNSGNDINCEQKQMNMGQEEEVVKENIMTPARKMSEDAEQGKEVEPVEVQVNPVKLAGSDEKKSSTSNSPDKSEGACEDRKEAMDQSTANKEVVVSE